MKRAIVKYLDAQIEKIDLAIFKIKSQINLAKAYNFKAVCGMVEGIWA